MQFEGPGVREKTATRLNIFNAGGIAKNVAFLLAIGDHYATNPAGPGFLRHEKEAAIAAEMPPSSDRRAILMCRDLRQRAWVCDLDGKNVRSYDGREADPASDFEPFWLDFYGEDLSLLTRVASKVTVEAMTASENGTPTRRPKRITSRSSTLPNR
jgi:hypothetical protein